MYVFFGTILQGLLTKNGLWTSIVVALVLCYVFFYVYVVKVSLQSSLLLILLIVLEGLVILDITTEERLDQGEVRVLTTDGVLSLDLVKVLLIDVSVIDTEGRV